jgi:hypothetical protein
VSYQVRPQDVMVVDPLTGRPVPPPEPRLAAWIRQRRLKLAAALALVEIVLLLVGDVAGRHLLIVGLVAVLGYFLLRDRLPPTLRQVAWVLAFAQGLVALLPAFIGFSLFVLGIVALLGLLVLMMVLLGDREKRG